MKFSESDFDCVILQQVILTRLRKQKPINMSFSQINHNIRRRQKPNDVFITPLALAKKHIKIVNGYCSRENALWLDPCKNSGNYYNNFNKKIKIIAIQLSYICVDSKFKIQVFNLFYKKTI